MRRSPLRRKTPLRAKIRMKEVSDKRKDHWKSDAGKAELSYMAAVKALPCVVCQKPGINDAHHCIHDRFGSAKRSGYNCIPLCPYHHQNSKDAIHEGKESWRKKHGPDWKYIAQTQTAILGEVRCDTLRTLEKLEATLD